MILQKIPRINHCTRKFSTVQQSQSNDYRELQNWRKLFEECITKRGLREEDWYRIPPSKILDWRGRDILRSKFKGSIIHALSTVFPEITWYPWKFAYRNAPRGFWDSINNQRQFFESLAKELEIKKLDDWYSILNNKMVLDHGGRAILTKHSNSSIQALMACFPEHEWKPWMFQTTMRRYWNSNDSQRQYFDSLGKKLGVEELDDWYGLLNKKTVVENGGASLLKIHGDSPIRAITACYPDHNWMPWKFNSTLLTFWSSKANVAQYISHLSEKLSIQTLDDWYRVDKTQIQHLGGRSILRKYGGLFKFLREFYPHHPWDPKRFATGKKAQRWLVLTLQKIFPGEGENLIIVYLRFAEILEDYQHPKALFPTSQRAIQLDVFVPTRSLAFEYQGKQHFEDVGFFQPTRTYQQRDAEKRIVCAENNIKLIEVPYWWNRTPESLKKMISEAT